LNTFHYIGKITLNHLVIKDELIIDENIVLPTTRPTQIYKNIVINGNLFLKNLEIETQTSLMFNDNISKVYNIHNILDNSWSRSKNQTIKNPIILEKGAIIDKLSCKYLNGLSEHDFLYVDSNELNDLENITFTNFHFNKIINESSGIVQNFVNESPDFITFHKTVRISHLTVNNMFTENYNGIPVDFIMQPNDTLKFYGITEFDVVRVRDHLVVEDLQMKRFNSRNANIFEKALRLDQNFEIDVLKTNELHVKNLQIDKLDGHNFEEALLAQENINRRSKISLTIDGDLDIEEILEVENINGKNVRDYIDMMKNVDPVDLMDTKNIKNLHVLKDLNVNTLNGHKVHDIFAGALSKTKKQTLSELTVSDVYVKYLTANFINEQNVSNLQYINKPSVFYGDVEFSELSVQGNILTKTLQGKDVLQVIFCYSYLILS
jgi:hypothetical protein